MPHFREEEEALFPLAAWSEPARPHVVQALLDHQQLHALAARLEARDDTLPGAMVDLADLLEQHVRREERELFPLLEQIAAEALAHWSDEPEGPLWGLASDDLNATLLAWHEGGGPSEHVSEERDVLIFVASGSASVTIDGDTSDVHQGKALIIEKGRSRSIEAGPHGVRYLSVHLRRPPLQIRPLGR